MRVSRILLNLLHIEINRTLWVVLDLVDASLKTQNLFSDNTYLLYSQFSAINVPPLIPPNRPYIERKLFSALAAVPTFV